jgi:hypothetical protein
MLAAHHFSVHRRAPGAGRDPAESLRCPNRGNARQPSKISPLLQETKGSGIIAAVKPKTK